MTTRRGKFTVLAGVPAMAVVLATSVAWACVSHTGPGAFHQRVVNLTGIEEARDNLDLDKDNVGGSGCVAGSTFLNVCVNQANVLVGVGVESGDRLESEVDGIPNADPGTLASQLTGTYKVRVTSQENCATSTAASTPPFVSFDTPSSVRGPVFVVPWTLPTVTSGITYYACAFDPAGAPVDMSGNPGAKVRLVAL